MKALLILSTLFSFSSLALESGHDIQIDFQTKSLRQTEENKKLETNWNNDKVDLVQGNMQFDLSLWEHKFIGNTYFKIQQSELIRDNVSSISYSTFPEVAVGRDLFKAFHTKTNGSQEEYAVLNRFEYEWGDDEIRMTAGRMFIDFGQGKFFNPINPFNLVNPISNYSNTSLGNDGLQFKIQKNSELTFHIYLLGDKKFTDYDQKITRSLFIRGDWNITSSLHMNYVISEDQKRHKYGLELKKDFTDQYLFAQVMRISQRLDNEDPNEEGHLHSVAGYNINLPNNREFRFEYASNSYSKVEGESFYQNPFIFKQLMAAHLTESLTDKIDIKLTYMGMPDSKFSFFQIAAEYHFGKFISATWYNSGPAGTASENHSLHDQQSSIPYEMGLILQGKF